MPQRRTLTSHVRAGILFDDRTHQVLVSTGSSVGHIQCYDVEKDVGATIIGASQQEVSKTETNEVRGARKIDHMGQRSIREKVMAYLSFESEKQKKKTFGIPFNRQQLADYLAVDRSALSAELSRMKKDGLIEFEKNIFTLL